MDAHSLMLIYQNVFNPVYFLLFSALIIIYYDYRHAKGSFVIRLLIISFAWVIAYIIYKLYFIFIPDYPQCYEDILAVAGLTTGITLTYALWRHFGYGYELICGMIAALSVSVPYAFISLFWNISGHVTYTLSPVIYIASIEKIRLRKIQPYTKLLFIIPALMVINRPLVHAHTWTQSIAAIFLSLLAFVGSYCYSKFTRSHILHKQCSR